MFSSLCTSYTSQKAGRQRGCYYASDDFKAQISLRVPAPGLLGRRHPCKAPGAGERRKDRHRPSSPLCPASAVDRPFGGGKVSTLSPPYLPKDGGRQETRFGLSECSFFFYGQAIGLPADRALGKVFSPPHKKICPRSLVNCKASQQSRAYS